MPQRCVVWGCSNTSDPSNNIALHKIPFEGDERPEAKRRRRQWVQFVCTKRDKWRPTPHSRVCSKHFIPEDFTRRFNSFEDEGVSFLPRLVSDEVGILPIPTVHAILEDEPQISQRDRRMILKDILEKDKREAAKENNEEKEEEVPSCSIDLQTEEPGNLDERLEDRTDKSTQTPECCGCTKLSSLNRQLKNKILDLKQKLAEKISLIHDLENERNAYPDVGANFQHPVEEYSSDEEGMEIEEEPELSSELSCAEANTETEMDTETTETETETEEEVEEEKFTSPRVSTGSIRKEPKFIVFLSNLLLLFHVCPACMSEKPVVKTKENGTMVEVQTICNNPACPKPENVWKSQPEMTGTRIPAGNFLLSFAILVSGCSASKVLKVFHHMGLCCISLRTYFRHQSDKLFPTIYLYWKGYQTKMFELLKASGEALVMAGDGRHDSMGHSAKYCGYTMFSCNIPLIIHFSIEQRNVAGNSPAMEYLGFKNCMAYLIECGLTPETFISDRHTSIVKHMREQLSTVTHYFDLWHISKKINKVLTKLSQEKECSCIREWIAPCQNHFLWSATTTSSGDGNVIWAKFTSFLSHVKNKHKDLPDPLFNKCIHEEEITRRKWLEEETVPYDKLCAALTKPSLEKGIRKASPKSQTSCLEGFHSVLNQYAPKMIAYSYPGMFCRHIIAAVHFNHNLHREVKVDENGEEQLKIVYPKFKNGQAVVRNVRVQPNFDYVEDIFQTFIKAQAEKTLVAAKEEIVNMTPQPMNTMLEKESREEAVERRNKRRSIVVEDVPPTGSGETGADDNSVVRNLTTTNRTKPKCSFCKQPMKGHKNVKECPRNQQKENT